MALIECVPNFSEGRRKDVIDAIASAISQTDGCKLLDVDPGTSTNRTVYTFVGGPKAIVQGALNAAKVAFKLIDMTKHQGEHPRLGALDVCPFIPVKDVTMEDCAQCAREFGEKLASDLGVPVYLYGAAATKEYRKTLPQIRTGEYEGLRNKIEKEEWEPDYGPAKFVPSWGATVTGARKFLIAYNINILGTKEQAHRIALNIREQGRSKDEPGRLKFVQGIGWWLQESNLAQVSVNILDYEVTPIYKVFEECVKDAKEMKLPITGSQIVGLVPLNAMLDVARHYIDTEGLFILEEDQMIRLVIDRLGLSSISNFDPKERIIEYMVDTDKRDQLVDLDVRSFIKAVGARTASPGGGTVAALCSTLGASLSSMVGLLSYGNRKFEHLDAEMRLLIPQFYNANKKLSKFIDEDAKAYDDVMLSMKLPKSTDEEAKKRDESIQAATKNAARVPLNLAKLTNELWPALHEISQIGNINCKSDLQVGAKCLETGVFGAMCNVLINLDGIQDSEYVEKSQSEIQEQWKIAQENCAEILDILAKRQK